MSGVPWVSVTSKTWWYRNDFKRLPIIFVGRAVLLLFSVTDCVAVGSDAAVPAKQYEKTIVPNPGHEKRKMQK